MRIAGDETMPPTAFIGGSWCCGSTALNMSLIQHPSIAGHREETLDTRDLPADWPSRPWLLFKNPQGAFLLDHNLARLKPDQLILLTRNPYAIAHSIVTTMGRTLRWACAHISYYYVSLLEAEQQRPAGSTYKVRFEDVATRPAPVLTDLLSHVFGLPFDPRCLCWELKEGDVRLGLGNPKICKTKAWEAGRTLEWRTGLSVANRNYVRNNLIEIFRDLGYDPDDVDPRSASRLRLQVRVDHIERSTGCPRSAIRITIVLSNRNRSARIGSGKDGGAFWRRFRSVH